MTTARKLKVVARSKVVARESAEQLSCEKEAKAHCGCTPQHTRSQGRLQAAEPSASRRKRRNVTGPYMQQEGVVDDFPRHVLRAHTPCVSVHLGQCAVLMHLPQATGSPC